MKRPRRSVPALLIAALALPAPAGAAAWDTAPLELAPAGSNPGAIAVTTTADGASWALWTEHPSYGSAGGDIVARRVSAAGVVGERRVLAPDSSAYGAVALAAASETDVRVAYVTGPGQGTAVMTRRLDPAGTGDADALYDKDSTDDGNVADNGPYSENLALRAAPGGGAWVVWTRENNGVGRSEARHVDGSGAVGALVTIADAYGLSAATAPSGELVAVYPQGAQGRVLATRIATSAGAPEAPIVLRSSSPPAPPYFLVQSTSVTVDGAGIATAGWGIETVGTRFPEVARFDAGATPMTTQGGGPTALSDGIPDGYGGYQPLLAADSEGDVLAAWYETTSFSDEFETIVRELGAGSMPAAIGPRLQLDGPKPEASSPFAVVPESASQTRVVFAGHDHGADISFCRASRIGDGGTLIGTDTIATGCASPVAPTDAGNGLSIVWTGSQASGHVRLSRWVESAPTCEDGAPAQVQAGRSIELKLPCDGWRPLRETAAPARGTLGTVDQSTGEVTYAAGATPGADEVRFRAVNAAGASAERRLAVTVTPAPEPIAHPLPAGPPAAAPTVDSSAPVISQIRVMPRRVAAGARGGPLLSFRLSELATVRIRVQVRANGRRSGGKCRTAPKLQRELRRKPPCQTWLTVADTTRRAPAGSSSLRLRGSRGRALPRGAYRVLVSATDAAGNRSREARTVFDVTR